MEKLTQKHLDSLFLDISLLILSILQLYATMSHTDIKNQNKQNELHRKDKTSHPFTASIHLELKQENYRVILMLSAKHEKYKGLAIIKKTGLNELQSIEEDILETFCLPVCVIHHFLININSFLNITIRLEYELYSLKLQYITRVELILS